VGDNVLVIADGGVFYPGVGGTSCAAPLWGALTALVNQQSASLGRSSVGFINPTLYALSRGQYYNGVFNDITNGNNTWSASTNFYFAVTNYDLCTGLGTPKAAALIAALTSITNVPASLAGLIPAPAQPWGTTLSVMSGSNPNGYWLLYDRNQSQSYGGTNYNGWMVNLTTADPVGYTADNQLTVNTTVNSQFLGDVTNVTFTPGSTWQMTLAETNYGPSISSNVFVLDTLPGAPGVTVISSNATAGSITAFGGNLVWNLGNLPVNAGGTLNLNLRANAAGLYTNSATVNASTLDPNSDDDSITVIASVAVTTAPAIQPRFTAAGGAGGFQLSVLNDANSTVIIQASSNLVTWVPVFTNMAPFTFTNFDSTNYQKRFYRALISQ